jgi:hypothetical protein
VLTASLLSLTPSFSQVVLKAASASRFNGFSLRTKTVENGFFLLLRVAPG